MFFSNSEMYTQEYTDEYEDSEIDDEIFVKQINYKQYTKYRHDVQK